MPHDIGTCRSAVCELCAEYAKGYAAGKDKAYFEAAIAVGHAGIPPCQCSPCVRLRAEVASFAVPDVPPGT